MIELGLRSGKPRKGFVAAYQASISELRQLMEADRERAKPVWTTEERKTFLGILNTFDATILKMLSFRRKLLYALLFILAYLSLPYVLRTTRSEISKFEDASSYQHGGSPQEGSIGQEKWSDDAILIEKQHP